MKVRVRELPFIYLRNFDFPCFFTVYLTFTLTKVRIVSLWFYVDVWFERCMCVQIVSNWIRCTEMESRVLEFRIDWREIERQNEDF